MDENNNRNEQKIRNEDRNEQNTQIPASDDKTAYKLICALGYVPCGLLFFLPLIVYSNDEFAKYHANQALVLFLTAVIGEVVLGVLSVIPFLSGVMYVLTSVYSVLMLVLCILGILNVVREEKNPLPVIGKINLLK